MGDAPTGFDRKAIEMSVAGLSYLGAFGGFPHAPEMVGSGPTMTVANISALKD
jgi:hypothetical protein